ncbi:hypothetical protein HYPBUDRAFT_114862 [Hyphopichia burtonii NRRL Y-1933]|uniref:Uncharacterized protein n=1 Tax=Hyphopichia burtonii NRRL Y-1933 TaxID=984485 RepID=A0A1E4RCX6_9ASCO|nr:hypothetical protein HYPBUDRAFT_114862 [Hyphopichia burtonii NRRL Y-1933]ODV64985.1 hypothetical protein HYPBUDRAFT_114862 [Hyphopichia burtonii NRRL Y-1933]
MSSPGAKAITVLAVIGVGWYTGVKFWQPLIIEQLRKDGNLRDDVYIHDTSDTPKSWEDVRAKWKSVVNPEKPDPIKDEKMIQDFKNDEKKVIENSRNNN